MILRRMLIAACVSITCSVAALAHGTGSGTVSLSGPPPSPNTQAIGVVLSGAGYCTSVLVIVTVNDVVVVWDYMRLQENGDWYLLSGIELESGDIIKVCVAGDDMNNPYDDDDDLVVERHELVARVR